jgi:hypothetical protein
MFSVEMDHDEIEITVMDDHGHNEDLKVNLFDDVIYIRQYNEATDRDELIQISPDMWDELVAAIHSPEGVFRTVKK